MIYLKVYQDRLEQKIDNIIKAYKQLIFEPVGQIELQLFETFEKFREPPEGEYKAIQPGEKWGGENVTGWFRGNFLVPTHLEGEKLFITARMGAQETLLFVNGVPKGIFTAEEAQQNRGVHTTLLLTGCAQAGEKIDVALESYCWFNFAGCMPYDEFETKDRIANFNGVQVEIMNQQIKDFVFNLLTVYELAVSCTDQFKKATLFNCLQDVESIVYNMPKEHGMDKVLSKVLHANQLLESSVKTETDGGYVGLIGHSHMDTAWIWPMEETIRKCARTYSNALSLMEQYPFYTFIQSSAYHSYLMKQHYPSIWEKMKLQIEAGRYEPNGGSWIECDCNIPCGESMIRQFLWGQNFYKENCGYQGDTFWLPDTFGYSAALPQILNGCGIKYFATTKLSWNDTNKFPYTSFIWRGLDGSSVITHLNMMQCDPGPKSLKNALEQINYKRGCEARLCSYGIGDGGGGPGYDWIELAKRANAKHTTVSKFMDRLTQNSDALPVYHGELYLEFHRGTLTSIHNIKRNNRLAETALRNMEMLYALLGRGNEEIDPLYETLLVNQFHDILPGTSLNCVNDLATEQMEQVITAANMKIQQTLSDIAKKGDKITLFNGLSWGIEGFYITDYNLCPQNAACQRITNAFGEKMLYIDKLGLEPLTIKSFETTIPADNGESSFSSFSYRDGILETPLYHVEFDSKMAIKSLILKTSNRQISSGLLNEFLIGEDVPVCYDNWEVDYETILNLKPDYQLTSSRVVCHADLQIRIENTYTVGENSTILQHIVFYSSSPKIDFETVVNWDEKHAFLKVGFDLNILADYAKHEIQFGFIERPTFKRNTYEQAMYEVSNHKYTDISETNFGVTICNDCKYGISADGKKTALSLLKAGTHPDTRADKGTHRMTYSIVPHGGFSAENVVKPAYMLNTPVYSLVNSGPISKQIISVDKNNIVVEAIKPACDGQGIIVRLYECQKMAVNVFVSFYADSKVFLTNMLEENIVELDTSQPISFRAFEIKTLRVIPRDQ